MVIIDEIPLYYILYGASWGRARGKSFVAHGILCTDVLSFLICRAYLFRLLQPEVQSIVAGQCPCVLSLMHNRIVVSNTMILVPKR